MELLGSLLFKLTGTTGRVQPELLQEDESLAAEAQTEIMKQALGTRRRNQVQLYAASEWGFSFRFFLCSLSRCREGAVHISVRCYVLSSFNNRPPIFLPFVDRLQAFV